ncbi:hypothetical protein [Rhodococcoides fascians]|uniref:hypothetical protein n=1 Tax=Rhodococcoides fascians TaxID=1828 RepID=UPI003530386C
MTFQHNSARRHPIAPTTTAPIKRRRWLWILAAVLMVVFVIGRLTPDTASTDPAAQLAGSSVETTGPTPTLLSPTVSITPTPHALLTPPAPALSIGSPAAATSALTQLSTIDVKGRAAKTGYDRDLFGQSWSDDVTVDGGHNGCDTRNDVLRRDLTAVTSTDRSGGCVVTTGVLSDPYTDTDIEFLRGEDTSTAVQIDHGSGTIGCVAKRRATARP